MDSSHAANSDVLSDPQQLAAGARERAFRELLALVPGDADALRGLAALLAAKREWPEAVELLRKAIAARPDDVPALCDLGNALVNARQAEEGVTILQQALAMAPADDRLHNNLGLGLTALGRFEAAELAFREALRLQPRSAPAYNNLGSLYIAMGRHADACGCFDAAEHVRPGYLHARCNRAIASLSLGDFARGWRDYLLRWERPESPHRPYAQPLWQGEALAGRRILLHTEEGLGDRIQFVRYAALLRARGAHVICETPMPLLEVFRGVRGVDEVVELGAALPAFDCHAPLLSLPHYCGTTLENVPAGVPYVTADAGRVAHWREYFAAFRGAGERLVGVQWQGNPFHQWDLFRSMRLMELVPLAAVPGVRLVSLQRGPGIQQIEGFQRATGGKLLVPTDGQQNTPAALADTAAMMMHVDLIVTVDTSTAHLAGALARPVWVMVAAVADWRWMAGREDSPWYPTMRLFRQEVRGEWKDVVARVERALCTRSRANEGA